MMPLRLLADDLTGALDSAAQFTGGLGAVPVLLGAEPATVPASFALDLNCRDGSEHEAVRRARATAPHLVGASTAFKKIDSLLRGHWAAELAAIAQLRLFDRVVLAPAFPAQGRVTRQGRQLARDLDGHWSAVPVDPVRELARRGVAVSGLAAIAEGLGPALVMVCDAETDQDLDALVAAGRHDAGRTLWCGSAGLARALATAAPRVIEPPATPHLVLVGSNHAVTRRQLARLELAHPDGLVRFGAESETSTAAIAEALTRHRCCVAVPALKFGLTAKEAEQHIAFRLAAILPRLPRPEAVMVVGGETFAAVCRILNCGVLLAEGEWRPGVPVSRMAEGLWAGTRCFSKSGAFGGDDLLLDLLGLTIKA